MVLYSDLVQSELLHGTAQRKHHMTITKRDGEVGEQPATWEGLEGLPWELRDGLTGLRGQKQRKKKLGTSGKWNIFAFFFYVLKDDVDV